VLPAQDRISLPLRAGDSAWHEFLESPQFLTDLLTGHEPIPPGRARLRRALISPGACVGQAVASGGLCFS
jgi:hypothetical protein